MSQEVVTDASLLGSSPWQLPLKSLGFPGGSVVENPPAKLEMQVRSLDQKDALEEGMPWRPLQDSCLENPMDRGAWRATSPWGCTELDMTEQQLLSSLAGWEFRKGGAAGVAQLCRFSLVSALGHAHPSPRVVLL